MKPNSSMLRFFGVAAYELINSKGQHILIDPFISGNPKNLIKISEFKRVDLIIVSHAAYDHFGDTEEIARLTGAPVICGSDVGAYLKAKGIPAEQIRTIVWGIAVEVASIKVQPVENHHWSQIYMPDGSIVSGVPNSYIVYVDPGIRFYHCGDTALFSDLKLIRHLYNPTIGCLAITNPVEIDKDEIAAGHLLSAEMSPYEGALAAQYLGLDIVLPCHYINPECDDIHEFHRFLSAAKKQGKKVPRSVVLSPGEMLELQPSD